MLFKRKAKRLPAERRPVPKPETIIQKGFGNEMPPQRGLVDIYFDQKNHPSQAAPFYEHYTEANWSSPKGTPYRNWKLLAGDWIFNFEERQKLRRRLRENLVAEL
ncbi:MAG TPA: hypothetical protein VIM55_10205 [Mucilaginibacter sp.]